MKPDPELDQLASDEMRRAAMKAQELGIDDAAIAYAALDLAGFMLVSTIGKDGARALFQACLEYLDEGGWEGAPPDIGDPPSRLIN